MQIDVAFHGGGVDVQEGGVPRVEADLVFVARVTSALESLATVVILGAAEEGCAEDLVEEWFAEDLYRCDDTFCTLCDRSRSWIRGRMSVIYGD